MEFSKIMVILCLLLFAGLLWWQDVALLDETAGNPKVIDGDSLEIQNERIRLKGIDAPEERQFCQQKGVNWPCGRAATKALKKLIGNNKVICEGTEFDKYERLLAKCYVGKTNINQWMVSEGWAVSFGGSYYAEQLAAKSDSKGLWRGTFMMPRDWRRQNSRR